MARTVLTHDGDVVDALAFTVYGPAARSAEAVLAANPRLADFGPVLPAGLVVVLPDLPAAKPQAVVRLWD